MAAAVLFSIATDLLSELSSHAFTTAFQQVQSICGAKEDIRRLTETVETIQAVLLDAERRQQNSDALKIWIEKLRDVLYEADDLFDDVVTDALLKQQHVRGDNPLTKVLDFFSNWDISKKIKAIRKRLDDISADMAPFNLIQRPTENQMVGFRGRVETRPFADERVVIGREVEKRDILGKLFDNSIVEPSVSVIAIVGIGGMGKTSLAQLIFNSEEVQQNFENKWWACISDVVGRTNVLEKIARSIVGQIYHGSDPAELISRSVKDRKYLLVLDDVWDNNLSIWVDIMPLLRRGAQHSKIIVTTRYLSVPRAMQNDNPQIYTLGGLSEDMSWELFRRIAFTEEQEEDPRWVDLGKMIMKKCANVPLAIKSIACLLLERNTIQEWEYFNAMELLEINLNDDHSIMSALQLSYNQLPSNLKNCFAYCSLFPNDYRFGKDNLICQWIAQGYVKPNGNETFEEVGHAYFMELLRKSFFQEVEEDRYGEIESCKMHDLIHELAKIVAGEDCLTLTTGWNQYRRKARHLYVRCRTDYSNNIPPSLLNANRLRSCFFNCQLPPSQPILDALLTKLKLYAH